MRHATREELMFLKSLGTYRDRSVSRASMPRQELLKLYRAAAEERKDWGEINREAILSYLSGNIEP